MRTTKELRPNLAQSVWAILDDDDFHRIPECEACRDKEYRKLGA